MLLSDWLRGLATNRPLRSRKSQRVLPVPARIETLEDRCLLSTFTVTNLNDSGAGSLRQAVINANLNPNTAGRPDDIRFSQNLLNTSRVITLTSGQIEITDSVYILGPTFDPAGIIVSGNNNDRVFNITSTAGNVTLQFLTITQGSTGSGGGGIANAGPNTVLKDMVVSSNQGSFGGGISVDSGRVEIQRSKIISNSAAVEGGGIFNFSGTLVVNQTTIDSNLADSGGGIVTENGSIQTTITNSTISHNTAANGSGGGIANFSTTSTALTLQNSTIAGNVSMFGGGGISAEAGTVMVMNVTIANNLDFSTAADSAGGLRRIGGGTVTGINLIVSQNSGANNDDTNGGTAINGAGSQANLIGGNPQLGPLQDNGGPTFTMLPLPGSPVLGAGVTAGATTLDQRGYARNVSASGGGAPSVDQGAVEFFPTLTQPYAVSPGVNSGNLDSRAYNATSRNGNARFARQAYGSSGFEVRIALGDVNGDGTKDIITVPGPGAGVTSRVLVMSGVDPSQTLRDFQAFPGFFGGVFLAAGDITGDGIADIIAGSGAGGVATVRIFDGTNQNLLAQVFPFGGFLGGVHVASGDINGDGRADLIVAAGAGGGSRVRVYSGMTVIGNPTDASVISDFFAYDGFFGGVFVASGDVNGDGKDEIITGPGEGGGPHVKVFNQAGAMLSQLFAYAVNFTGGVRVAAVDANGDGFADIITGAGPGGGPHVRVFDGLILTTFGGGIDLASFFAFDPFDTGGIYVAGSKASAGGGSPLELADGLEQANRVYTAEPDSLPTAEDLANLTDAAIERFAAAGLDDAGVSLLNSATVEFADLPGNLLGLTYGNRILIDPDAAGAGYFIDDTPGDDSEFSKTGIALGPGAQGRVDLLTVITHELGHVLGLSDEPLETDPDELMADHLATGVRRFVREEDLAALDSAFRTENVESLLD